MARGYTASTSSPQSGINRRYLPARDLAWKAMATPACLSTIRLGSTIDDIPCSAVITGSAARAMVFGHDGEHPVDLNLVVPHGSFRTLHAFVKRDLGYRSVTKSAHPAIAPAVCLFRKYESNGRTITLSAPRPSQSILQIILNAPSTADMVFMSAGGVAWFYPQLLKQGVAIRSRSSNFVPLDCKLGYVGGVTRLMRLENDLEFTRRACGSSCPTLWHHVDDTSLRCFVDWNSEDTVTDLFGDVDVEWRLSLYCTNSHCRYRIAIMERNLHTDGAFNRNDVRYIPPEIRCRQPRFLQLITGAFYGSGCSRPYLIPVPVRDGVDRRPTLDDLDITYWVRQFAYTQCTASRRILRHTFDSVPYPDVSIGARFTAFFEIPLETTQPNHLLNRMANMSGRHETVLGSVLVVKQTRDCEIVDMSKGDQVVSNFLVSSFRRLRIALDCISSQEQGLVQQLPQFV
ncbi:hypothetical protein EDD22DRAFT_842526 [Suillus occidentalis]|nr:hypothetical protein EDD22DRAFT_842526 [Suillus occidentalis]